MAQPPRPGDSHGNLLWKITENTFEGGGGGGGVGPAGPAGATGPAGSFPPGIESSADETAMWITADENIGIGTSAPVSLLQIQAQTALAGTGTISTVGTTVTGVGTTFTTELRIGDTMIIGGKPVTVWEITSDTSLIIVHSFIPDIGAGTPFTFQRALQRWTDTAGGTLGFLDAQGQLSVGNTIGLAPQSAFININESVTNPFKTRRGLVVSLTGVATAAAVPFLLQGTRILTSIGATNTQNWTSNSAVIAWNGAVAVNAGATGTIGALVGFAIGVTNSAVGATVTEGFVFREGTPGGVGPFTNFTGISLRNRTTATNNCNFSIGPSANPAGNFSIYNNSTFNNYFEGSFGIGIVAPEGKLHVFSGSAGAVVADTIANELVLENSDHCGISILCPADKVGTIFFGDPGNPAIGQISYTHSLDKFTFTAGTVNAVEVTATALLPGLDNTISLGTAAFRWTEVFAVAPAINTSDAREKHDIENIEVAFARSLVDKITPRSYVWNSESQRGTHYGFVAQEIESVISLWGLSANEFAPLHYDRENDRYGLREAELLPFLWRVVQDLQRRVAAIET